MMEVYTLNQQEEAKNNALGISSTVLRKTAVDVTNINQTIESLLANMTDLIFNQNAAGIAAPQVGVSLRLFVVALGDGDFREFINPVILHRSGRQVNLEGCLSLPGTLVEVPRAQKIDIEWYDVDGQYHREKFSGRKAMIIQHEYDHLNGKLIIDYD